MKFYIIRNEYHTDNFYYAVCHTLAETVQFLHEEIKTGLLHDVVIEFCEGNDILFDYQVNNTMFYYGRTSKPLVSEE